MPPLLCFHRILLLQPNCGVAQLAGYLLSTWPNNATSPMALLQAMCLATLLAMVHHLVATPRLSVLRIIYAGAMVFSQEVVAPTRRGTTKNALVLRAAAILAQTPDQQLLRAQETLIRATPVLSGHAMVLLAVELSTSPFQDLGIS